MTLKDVCQILAIDKPIIQAPMAGSQNWELALAVSEAGGLGSIPCGMLNADQVVCEIENFKSHCDKPYNLNFFCHKMPTPDNQVLAAWQKELSQYYLELAVDPPQKISGLRVPFDSGVADAIEAYKPPVISFHFGLPSADLVARVKSWGAVILSSATTVDEALWLEANGADVVIAQGIEAGGHRAMFMTDDPALALTTRELVAKLTPVLSVPVVAAGGIALNRDIQEMMSLGASAVQVGTSYLLCEEAKTSRVHRQALKAALHSQTDATALTNIFSGRLARGITNKLMLDLKCITNKAPAFPYASIAIGPLRTKAESLNLPDFSPLWCGTNPRGCKEISAKQLTNELWRDNSE